MKRKTYTLIVIIFIIITACKHQTKNVILKKSNSDTAFYYADTSKWASILRYTPTEVKEKILENLRDTTYEFVAQMFLSITNTFPKANNITTIKFNVKEEFLIYNFRTSTFQLNNKNIRLLKFERTFLIDPKDFNPKDTVIKKVKQCDFWNLQPEIKCEGDDGEYYCIIIKNKDKIHYVLRWSPEHNNNYKVFPNQKEFVSLIHLFDRLGFYGYYHNDLNKDVHLLEKQLY